MTKLVWDTGYYETGVDRGVFYAKNGPGEVWNGLVSVQESPSGSDTLVRYIDGMKFQNRLRRDEFSGTIEAFFYPDAIRSVFGLSYRVFSNDSYKIHLIYNVLTTPTKFTYEQEKTAPFSWDFTTKAVGIPGAMPSAHLVIDVSKAYPETISTLEALLYGNEDAMAQLLSPEEIFEIFEANSILKVIDNGDGSFTVTGPDEAIQMLSPDEFQISWPSAIFIDEVSYKIRSL